MSHSKPTPRHTPHAHRMLQRSAAYLLAQACQIGPQRTKSLWLKEEDDDSCLIAVCLTVGANATPRPTLAAWATGWGQVRPQLSASPEMT